MRSKFWIVLALFALVGLAGCEIEVPGGEFITPTPVSRGPTPTPVIIGRPTINPTDTPRPLPPTPTSRPSPTPPPPTPTPEEPTPTSQPQEQETATAADPGATDTPTPVLDTPTPVPTDTPPPQVGTTEMVLIPAGPFIMGSNADDPDIDGIVPGPQALPYDTLEGDVSGDELVKAATGKDDEDEEEEAS